MPGAATQSELGHGYAGAPPRVSIESEGAASAAMSAGDGETAAASATDMATLVETSFDENILQSPCNTQVSLSTDIVLGAVQVSTNGWSRSDNMYKINVPYFSQTTRISGGGTSAYTNMSMPMRIWTAQHAST